MKTYVGIDLHSNSSYIGIIDDNDNKLFLKKLPNDLDKILLALNKHKEFIVGIVVESTYNWYWLVDGLQANGYKVHLSNPSANKQYSGLKYSDDKSESLWLASLLRLNILKEGYIYPTNERTVRDLLRRRMMFVQQRTAQMLSLQNMITRSLGIKKSSNDIRKMKPEDLSELFNDSHLEFMACQNLEVIRFMSEKIRKIEKQVESQAKLKPEYKLLKTINGVGLTLALTIMLETGDISRFPTVGNFSSYCRCVPSKRISNGKKKSEGNRKNGNRYLSWAFVEAAGFNKRYCSEAQKFYQRKASKTNKIIAIKALANKLARASYYIMKDQVEYDPDRLFG